MQYVPEEGGAIAALLDASESDFWQSNLKAAHDAIFKKILDDLVPQGCAQPVNIYLANGSQCGSLRLVDSYDVPVGDD
jgi:hypothetical protein